MAAPNTIKIDEVEYVRKDLSKVHDGPVKIVVLDRGFVYIGRVEIKDDFIVITNAKNIRIWGTSKGLGQLALDGQTSMTQLDDVGTVRAPMRALISMIDVDQSKWTDI